MAVTVVGLRHGIVENPGHVVYARLPGFVLSQDGRDATERFAARIAEHAIVAVYASPLERAQETAGILASPLGLPVHTEPRLIEWSFWTQWEGMPWAQLRELEPDVFSAYAEDPGRLHEDDPLAAVGEDIVAWAAEAAAEHADGTVLAVSHEAPLKAAYLASRGAPTSEYPRLEVHHLGAVRLHPRPGEMGRFEDVVNGSGIGDG